MKGKNENYPRGAGGTLQMKIIAGHLLLVLLVGGIIGTVWYEHRMLRRAGKAERTMLEQRRLSNTAFKSLIAMFLDNERLLLRDKDDLALYGEREAQVAASLDRLRESYPNPVQRARIDTVKALLGERRHQVGQSAGISAPLAGEARIAAVSDSLKMCNRVLDGNINRTGRGLDAACRQASGRRHEAAYRCLPCHLPARRRMYRVRGAALHRCPPGPETAATLPAEAGTLGPAQPQADRQA